MWRQMESNIFKSIQYYTNWRDYRNLKVPASATSKLQFSGIKAGETKGNRLLSSESGKWCVSVARPGIGSKHDQAQ